MHELKRPLDYDEVVEKFDLDILRTPGDLVIEDGDLASTKSGDLLINDVRYSAMFRLVQTWRFSAPMLQSLFELATTARARRIELEQNLNGVFSGGYDPSSFGARDERAVEFHELNDAIAASDLGAASCAAAIILILNGMLQAFKDDTDIQNAAWERAPPLFGAQSVGAILVAASNYFRHGDEWIKTQPPSTRQARSTAVLWAALGGANATDAKHPFNSEDACVQTLDVLGDQSFDQLNLTFFTFARNLAAK